MRSALSYVRVHVSSATCRLNTGPRQDGNGDGQVGRERQDAGSVKLHREERESFPVIERETAAGGGRREGGGGGGGVEAAARASLRLVSGAERDGGDETRRGKRDARRAMERRRPREEGRGEKRT